MFSRPWFALLRRHVLIHRRALAFCSTVAAVLLAWSAFVTRAPVISATPASSPAIAASSTSRPGFVRLPVRFADGEMAALLHPGERIQLWATDPRSQRSRLIARDAEVVDVPGHIANGITTGRQSRLIVVSVRVTEVQTVASFNANGVLTYAMDQ